MERWTSTSFAPSASCQLVVTAALRHWRQVTFLTGARSVPSIDTSWLPTDRTRQRREPCLGRPLPPLATGGPAVTVRRSPPLDRATSRTQARRTPYASAAGSVRRWCSPPRRRTRGQRPPHLPGGAQHRRALPPSRPSLRQRPRPHRRLRPCRRRQPQLVEPRASTS